MITFNIVVCGYDKMLVNVAAYVIPGYVCVVCVRCCVFVSFCHLWPVHLCIIFSVLSLINDAIFGKMFFNTESVF